MSKAWFAVLICAVVPKTEELKMLNAVLPWATPSKSFLIVVMSKCVFNSSWLNLFTLIVPRSLLKLLSNIVESCRAVLAAFWNSVSISFPGNFAWTEISLRIFSNSVKPLLSTV